MLPTNPPPAAFDTAPGLPPALNLTQALERFRGQGLDLLLADAALAGVEGDRRSASALPGAQLNLSAGRATSYRPSLPGQSAHAYGISVSDGGAFGELLSGRHALRTASAEATLRAARLGRSEALRIGAAQVKQQFLQASLAHTALELSRESQEAARQTLAIVRARLRAGTVSEVDLARSEVVALEADQAWEGARQGYDASRAALAFLLGQRGPAPVFDPVGGFERLAFPGALESARLEDLTRDALDSRGDLRIAAAQAERAQAALDLARREWLPDSNLSLGVSQQGTGQDALQPRTWTLGLGLTLPARRKVEGDRARAQADLSIQILQRQKLEAQITLDVAAAWAAYQGGRARLARLQGPLLAGARKAADLVAFQYERGAASMVEVLDAQRAWLAARGEYLQALNDAWSGLFQLEQAVGKEWS